jgi:hypothetical protein
MLLVRIRKDKRRRENENKNETETKQKEAKACNRSTKPEEVSQKENPATKRDRRKQITNSS